jgi:hypothetical protein
MLFYGFAHRTLGPLIVDKETLIVDKNSPIECPVSLIVDRKPPIEEKIVGQIDFESAECHLLMNQSINPPR